MSENIQFFPGYQKNIERAIKILRDAGCTDVFLFGSLATAQSHASSDIDLAIRGCPVGTFFDILGKLVLELDYPVDLIDLDQGSDFALYLEREGELVPIG